MRATRFGGVLLAVVGALATSEASGQTLELFGPDRGRGRFESSQNFALEFRGGPWYPSVDQEFGGRATPFRDIFGEGDRVLGAIEFDWQILRINPIGSLGVGLSVGYTAATAVAPVTQRPMPADPAVWNRPSGGQETALNVVPMTAVGVFRLDVLARRTVIPLVPYAKFGFAYSLWWIDAGDSLAQRTVALSPGASADDLDIGQDAIGGSLGTHFAAGMMLRLDFLEPRAARAWDIEMGVNHSYLFFEWARSAPGSLGSRSQLQLGTNTWAAGLAVEF